jgi:hypothetical protein
MSAETGHRAGTHTLETPYGDVFVDVVQMKNGDWKWYTEAKGWSTPYNASDVALAFACKTLKARVKPETDNPVW